MERIKFTELGFKKNLDTLIVVVGIICLVIGLIGVFVYPESKMGSLAAISASLTTFPQFKNLFFKNYFVWNKKGGNIKINSKSKSIAFSEVESFNFEENKLKITKKNKTQLEFSLNEINNEDIIKLKEILAKHIKKS
ncbi:hypothetical protein FLGE108171_13580 [Flavobacterium gelidilacus]|uniref:hypothetical protein n=1 Tax=Flavobacterium gelidilacus TaxID=206041 RepID=UPI000429BA2C|nr:hypothetical protein [Flavobacterium gelidilacus]